MSLLGALYRHAQRHGRRNVFCSLAQTIGRGVAIAMVSWLLIPVGTTRGIDPVELEDRRIIVFPTEQQASFWESIEPWPVLDTTAWWPPPRLGWTMTVGPVFLDRGTPDDRLLFQNTAAPIASISGSDFDFDFELGYEVALHGMLGHSGIGLELRHYEVDDWVANISQNFTAGNLNILFSPAFQIAGQGVVAAEYASDLESYEANLYARTVPLPWMQSQHEIVMLSGFRHFRVDEQLGAQIAQGNNTLLTQSESHLVGLQVGADFPLLFYEQWGLAFNTNLLAKGGIFASDNKHRTFTTASAALPQNWDSSTAYMCEMVFASSVRFQRFSFQLDYRFLWLDNIAVASNQIGMSSLAGPASNIDSAGNAYFHGLSLGFLLDF